MVLGGLLMAGASVTASVLVIQMAVLPLLFKYNKTLQRKMVFSTCIKFPRNINYENPSSVNCVGGRHFMIDFQSKVDDCPIRLGVWHLVPCSVYREAIEADGTNVDDQLHSQLQNTTNTIVLYCHGNSNHRASPNRLNMYRVFQELDFHVITFDYRGYGDSTGVRPTEKGVVEDLLAVYCWLLGALDQRADQERRPKVLMWGHSLGTAIVSNLVSNMAAPCLALGVPVAPPPVAVVLEAPFNNLVDEIEFHPLAKFVSWLPYFKGTFVKPFSACSEYAFTTDAYLTGVPELPVLILHARGDKIVPYDLAAKLHDTLVVSRKDGGAPLVFHTFERGLGLGHNNLSQASDLKKVVTDFMTLLNEQTTAPSSLVQSDPKAPTPTSLVQPGLESPVSVLTKIPV